MTDSESALTRLRRYLLDPDTFFAALVQKPPQYRGPLLIVLAAGILSAISSWLVMGWMCSFFLAGLAGTGTESRFISALFGLILVVASAASLFGPLMIAAVAGFVFYFLAGFVKKGGNLVLSITAAAWGMVPLAVYELVQIPLFLAFRPGMGITVSPEFFAMMNNTAAVPALDKQAILSMIAFNQPFYTYTMLNAGLHALAWLACAWFWIPAVRNTCAVEQRQAALIVLVPLLVYIAVTFGPALLTGGHPV